MSEQEFSFWLDEEDDGMSRRLKKELESKGAVLPPPKPKKSHSIDGVGAKKHQSTKPASSRYTKDGTSDQQSADTTAKTITINISAPSIDLGKQKRRVKAKISSLPLKRFAIIAACLIGALFAIVAGSAVYTSVNKPYNTSSLGSGSNASDTANFNILVPKSKLDKPVTAQNGYSYDNQRQLVAYSDTWADFTLTVSQQIVPDSFKNNPDSLAKAAKSINAKDSFNTKKGTVYLGNNTTDGQQIAMFTSGNLLVFIRSNQKIEKAVWTDYINLLTIKKP